MLKTLLMTDPQRPKLKLEDQIYMQVLHMTAMDPNTWILLSMYSQVQDQGVRLEVGQLRFELMLIRGSGFAGTDLTYCFSTSILHQHQPFQPETNQPFPETKSKKTDKLRMSQGTLRLLDNLGNTCLSNTSKSCYGIEFKSIIE